VVCGTSPLVLEMRAERVLVVLARITLMQKRLRAEAAEVIEEAIEGLQEL